MKTFENARKINNAFKKIAKFCKKVIVIIINQIVNVTKYFLKKFHEIHYEVIKQIYHKQNITFYHILQFIDN